MEYIKHKNRKVEAYWSASRPKLIGKPKLRPRPISNPLKAPTALRATPPAAQSPQSYEALPKNLRVLARRMDTLDNIRGAQLIAKELDKASATLNTGVPVRRSPEEVAAARAERERVFLSRPGFQRPGPGIRSPAPSRESLSTEPARISVSPSPASIRSRSPSPAIRSVSTSPLFPRYSRARIRAARAAMVPRPS